MLAATKRAVKGCLGELCALDNVYLIALVNNGGSVS